MGSLTSFILLGMVLTRLIQKSISAIHCSYTSFEKARILCRVDSDI
jgi:hypothetical protein